MMYFSNHAKNIFRWLIILLTFAVIPLSFTKKEMEQKDNSDTMDKIHYPGVFNLSAEDKSRIETKIGKMTVEEKCAQMIMPAVYRSYLDSLSPDYERIIKLVTDYKVGGLIFFQGDLESELTMINKLQGLSEIPLLIASDFEKGPGMRIDEATLYPYSMAVAATGDVQLAYQLGKAIAEESRMLGFHLNFAPVADVNYNPENPVINVRSFSEDKNIVANFCSAFIKGSTEGRMLSCAKHFPGHGNTDVDSHTDIPVIRGNRDYLIGNELFPFIKSINAGVPSIMIGHLSVPAFEETPDLPATLSASVVTNLLKGELNFDGLIISDAMNMSTNSGSFLNPDVDVMAVIAGNDIILMPPDPESALDSLIEKVKSGVISESRINQSVRKILAAKRWLQLEENKFVNIEDAKEKCGQGIFTELAQTIADRSITLIKNEKDLIPIKKSKLNKVSCITITDGDGSSFEDLFQGFLEDSVKEISTMMINSKSKRYEYSEALGIAAEADIIILAAFIQVKAEEGTVGISEKQKDLIDKILKLDKHVVLISFRNPYLLSLFPNVDAYLCSYGGPPVSQYAMFKAIFGKIKIQGKLPVSIPNTEHKIGDGITLQQSF